LDEKVGRPAIGRFQERFQPVLGSRHETVMEVGNHTEPHGGRWFGESRPHCQGNSRGAEGAPV